METALREIRLALLEADVSVEVVKRFIDLANQMKDEGQAPPSVNAALMLASGLYATYLAVGNEGRLDPKAIDQVAGVYRSLKVDDTSGDEIYVCRTTPCSIANTP